MCVFSCRYCQLDSRESATEVKAPQRDDQCREGNCKTFFLVTIVMMANRCTGLTKSHEILTEIGQTTVRQVKHCSAPGVPGTCGTSRRTGAVHCLSNCPCWPCL